MATRGGATREPPPLTDPLVRALTDLPRTGTGEVDLDAVTAALMPADLLDSGDRRGWSYVVPHGGPVLIDDGQRSRFVRRGGAAAALRPGAATDPEAARATDVRGAGATDVRGALPADDGTDELGTDPFDALDQVVDRYGLGPDAPRLGPTSASADGVGLPPFTGGLVGAFAYDLARRIERLPTVAAADRRHRHLSMRVAHVVLAVPPDRSAAVLLVHPGETDSPSPSDIATGVTERLRHARDHVGATPRAPRAAPRSAVTSLPRDDYLDAVTRVLEHIAAGDSFQVNLAQRLTARWDGDTFGLYRAMRATSPAAFGAMLPDIGVASISPETFLAVDGRRVTTRPIKGTRPRAADPALDAAFADDLATAEKDRAENIMIVDLERNDLGRVAVPGSIHVPRLLDVEGYPTVWHLVSTVTGELRGDVGYGDLLRATFPCGSITGAPKVAAMHIIERLEPVRRGWYCGAIGYLGAGTAHLSVAIRTATLHPDGLVDHGAGGGIVADSDPGSELAESLDKAAAFLRAVAATHVADARGDDRHRVVTG